MKVAWILGEDTKCLMTKSVDAVCKHTAANWTSGKQFLFNCNFAHLFPALYTQMPRKQTHTLSFFLSLLSSACISPIFFPCRHFVRENSSLPTLMIVISICTTKLSCVFAIGMSIYFIFMTFLAHSRKTKDIKQARAYSMLVTCLTQSYIKLLIGFILISMERKHPELLFNGVFSVNGYAVWLYGLYYQVTGTLHTAIYTLNIKNIKCNQKKICTTWKYHLFSVASSTVSFLELYNLNQRS